MFLNKRYEKYQILNCKKLDIFCSHIGLALSQAKQIMVIVIPNKKITCPQYTLARF